jgi:rhodanese-related sulfurtransferase
VSGALNIPVDQIEAAILTAVPEKADVVILYCRSGNRSAQAADILEDLGYLVILDAGGINSYKGELVL